MTFWHWLTMVSPSAAPPTQPGAPRWSYVLLALALPAACGLLWALILKGLEKLCGLKLGQSDV
jgi:hypothetical protein